jgi:acyl-CoA thioesterase II
VSNSKSGRPAILSLDPCADGRFRVENEGDAEVRNVVFGGQLLAQMIAAASDASEGKFVKTIHAIFARAGRVDANTELQIETLHSGRAMASHTITAWQGDRLCSRSMVLMSADEPDLIEHHPPMPKVVPPDDAGEIHEGGLAFPGAEYIVVGDVDMNAADQPVAPATLDVWYRSPNTPEDRSTDQSVLAWATDGFLIATAMRPHAGIGQERAHVDLSTGVLSHTLTFHRPFSLRDWVLMSHESPFAGGGRTYGRCHIFDRSGALVASYVQDNMVRSMPGGAGLM